VREHLLWAGVTLALLTTACGGGSTASTTATPAAPACVNAKAAHHAYLVVEHLSGATVQRCVGFAAAQLSGDDLMQQSGIEYQAQTFSGLGKAVCQVDNEPAQFTECFPKDKPFWAELVSTGGAWQEAQTGYAAIELKDGDALGWQYHAQTAMPSPPPLPRK